MSLKGLNIAITGKFTDYTRKEAGEGIKAAGAKVGSSVSAKTDLLIAGSAAGSKLYQAYNLHVPILAQAHLKLLLEGTNVKEVVALARTFYTLKRVAERPAEGSLNQIGGVPPVSEARWPTDSAPMNHHFTLDLTTMPALAMLYPDHRALSLFIVDSGDVDMYQLSWSKYGRKAQVVFSTQAQIDEAGAPPAAKAAATPRGWLEPVAHAWEELPRHFGRERVLGAVPQWCQQENHQGNFIMQFGEDLGVAGDGLIYMFDDSVFAQFS